MNLKTLFTILLLLISANPSFSQESIEEARSIANKLFENEKYAEAMPYYVRLLAQEPRDHNLNYRYGTCLLYNPTKNQDVFKYLNYAVTGPAVETEAYYFLGKALHLNYQFNDAIKRYQEYQTKAGSNVKASLDVKRQIDMCNNGKKLITTITEMIVIDKKEIEKDKFFRIYDLSDIGGNLLVTAEFQTKLDQKKGHVPLIHFPATPTVIYYSSYGENGKTGKDIYVQRRLPTGGWGVAQALQGGVNTPFDEDYPYMHPDGKYLYFSSKGHNSMGGFDVFRCKYDEETDMFGLAENMDFAVSSPNDDLFYVVDSLNRNAYFGSNRQTEEGKLNVYKVRVDRVPLNMTVIKGEFSSSINPQQKKVFVDVKDYASGEFIGNFNSNDKGSYLITFPKGGKYELTIRVGDNPQEYKVISSIPFQKEFKPLKQKIIHELQEDRENVKVVDLFNENVEDPQAVFAQVVRMKSVLTPNVSHFNLDELDKERKSKEVLNELGIGNLSLVEVGYLLEEEVKDAQKAENGTAELENKLRTQVVANALEVDRLEALVKSKLDRANAESNDKRKYKLLKEVERTLKTIEEIKIQSDKSVKYADSLARLPVKGSSAATAQITRFSEEFNALMKENKQAEAFKYLYDNKVALKKIIDEKTPDPLQVLIERGLVLDGEIDRLQPKDDEYAREIRRIESEIATLQQSKVTAKSKEIEAIDAKIKAKNDEKAMVAEERSYISRGLNEQIAERSAIRKQVDLLEAIYLIKTTKQVSKEELGVAIGAIRAVDAAGEKSKIAGQIDELIKRNPSVKEMDYSDLAGELGGVATTSKAQADKIRSNPNLTEQQKASQLRALDRDFLASVNKELSKAKQAARANPNDPQAKAKLEALQNARALVASSLDVADEDDATMAAAASTASNTGASNPNAGNTNAGSTGTAPTNGGNTSSTSGSTAPTAEQLIASLNPSYSENMKKINGNPALSEKDKLEELQKVDQALLAAVNKEINANNTALSKNPNDAVLLKKQEGLQKIKTDLTAEIATRSEAISAGDVASSSQPLSAKDKENIIESVNASYNEKVGQIKVNETLSASEKLNQLQQADRELVASLNEKIKAAENASKKDPGNAALSKELSDLKVVRSEIEAAMSSRETAIAASNSAGNRAPLDPGAKEKIIESINASYNEKVDQIRGNASLSERDKLNQLQLADKELVALVDKEISKVEGELKKSPNDGVLKKELNDLKVIKSDVDSAIASRQSEIAAGSTSSVVNAPVSAKEKEAMIAAISPSYNEKVAKINKDNTLNETQKLEQLQAEDKSLLSALNQEITKANSDLRKNPTDPVLKKKAVDLETVKKEVEAGITNRSAVMASTGKPLSQKEKAAIVDALSPMHNVRVADINKNNSLSETEKLSQLQQVDRELINSITKEITALENNIKNNPDPQLTKELADYKAIKAELEAAVASRDKVLNPTANANTAMNQQLKTSVIESVSPSYLEKVEQIRSNTALSSTDKAVQLQQLDKELLTVMHDEIVKTESEWRKNPSDTRLEKKLNDLKAVQKELENSVADRSSEIASLGGGTVSSIEKANIIEGITPAYNEQVAQINSDKTVSELERNNRLQQAERELLVSVNKELVKAEAEAKKKPSDATLQKRVAGLQAVKADLERSMATRDAAIASSGGSKFTRQEKVNLIKGVDAAYNQKVVEIDNNTALSEKDKLNQKQALDQELLIRLDKELTKVQADFKKNPSDEKVAQKMTDLTVLKSELNGDIQAREKEIASTANVSNSASTGLTVAQKEKNALISSVTPTYLDKVNQINENTTLSEAEKMQQTQQLDKDLAKAIEKELIKTESELAKTPNNTQLTKKASDLNTLKAQLQSDITARESILAANHPPVDPQVKSSVIKSVDSKYEKKVTTINSNTELSVTEKLNQIQELDYALVADIDKKITANEAAMAKKPGDVKMKAELDNLKSVKHEMERSIAGRESILASSGGQVDEKRKAELIENVSPSHNEKVLEVKNSAYLLDTEKLAQLQELDKKLVTQLGKEIASLESELKQNPNNAQAKRKVEQLNVVKAGVESDMKAREKLMTPTASNNALAAKASLIETVSADYNEKVAAVHADAHISELDKLTELQRLDNELLTDIDKQLVKATKASKSKPKEESLKAAKEELADLKEMAEEVIAEREIVIEQQKASNVSAQQKSAVIAEVKPDHEAKMKQISSANSDPSLKFEELLKEEGALLTRLESEEKTVQSAIKKAPRDQELKTKAHVIDVLQTETERKIAAITKEAVTLKASKIDQAALMGKVDPSFDTDISTLVGSTSASKASDLAQREVQLQEKIEDQIAENKKKLANNFDFDIAAENQILAQKIKESKAREERYQGGATTTEPVASANRQPTTGNHAVQVEELRKELLGGQSSELSKNYTSVEALKDQEELLINYADLLSTKLEKINGELRANPAAPSLLAEKEVVQAELENTEQRVKAVANQIEVLEGVTAENTLMSPHLQKIIDQENSLNEQLKAPNLTNKQRSGLEKELAAVKVEKKTEENKLITKDMAQRKVSNKEKSNQVNSLASTSDISKTTAELATSQNARLTQDAENLIQQAEKVKDPVAKNTILTEAIEKQRVADRIIQDALEENTTRAAIVNEVSTLDSKEELEQKQQGFQARIADQSNQIDALESKIAATSPKKSSELIQEKQAIETEKRLTEDELMDINRQLAEIEIAEMPSTLHSNALNEVVSIVDENRIVASKEYMEYSINATKALRIENEIAETEVILTEKKQIAKELVVMSLDKSSKVSAADVKESVQNVKVVEEKLTALKSELAERQNVARNILTQNEADAMKMQNILKRGVEPELVEALAVVEKGRAPAEGLKYVTEPVNAYSEANPIPVNVKNPTGLVYRIQVGAFSKPIPQDMYKSFSPVSGEKLVSGITRYMAGYFNNSATVETAHAQVRTLGYSDAFIVAYCDEERIPLAEAKRLEETGQCISTESREFVIAMASKQKPTPVNAADLSYNTAPGAVKATPVEAHLGLFYTVQVGVYNKPATAKQLHNIDPLVTKRLPNGQIRYSTGMFTSVDEANPKKAEAREKGVKDAFVTAYYKGERITLSEASHLLRLNGNGIMEKIDESTLVSSVDTQAEEVKTKPVNPVEVVKTQTSASDYNKGPGAVPATAVETRLGLFFTVQIGVYSKPATMKQLNYVSPLITKKLPNGQLRYSTGMFKSIEEAEPKRKEALAKGVKHAYITAYYQGERITIAEAKELLRTQGDSVLEK